MPATRRLVSDSLIRLHQEFRRRWDKPPGRRASDSRSCVRTSRSRDGLVTSSEMRGRRMVAVHGQLGDGSVKRQSGGQAERCGARGAESGLVELRMRRNRAARPRLSPSGRRRCETSADRRAPAPRVFPPILTGPEGPGAGPRAALFKSVRSEPQRGCTGAGASRGLQNRLRGPDEGSLVGSIPIHPRHFLSSDHPSAASYFLMPSLSGVVEADGNADGNARRAPPSEPKLAAGTCTR